MFTLLSALFATFFYNEAKGATITQTYGRIIPYKGGGFGYGQKETGDHINPC